MITGRPAGVYGFPGWFKQDFIWKACGYTGGGELRENLHWEYAFKGQLKIYILSDEKA